LNSNRSTSSFVQPALSNCNKDQHTVQYRWRWIHRRLLICWLSIFIFRSFCQLWQFWTTLSFLTMRFTSRYNLRGLQTAMGYSNAFFKPPVGCDRWNWNQQLFYIQLLGLGFYIVKSGFNCKVISRASHRFFVETWNFLNNSENISIDPRISQ
jgi:hypothetical protein